MDFATLIDKLLEAHKKELDDLKIQLKQQQLHDSTTDQDQSSLLLQCKALVKQRLASKIGDELLQESGSVLALLGNLCEVMCEKEEHIRELEESYDLLGLRYKRLQTKVRIESEGSHKTAATRDKKQSPDRAPRSPTFGKRGRHSMPGGLTCERQREARPLRASSKASALDMGGTSKGSPSFSLDSSPVRIRSADIRSRGPVEAPIMETEKAQLKPMDDKCSSSIKYNEIVRGKENRQKLHGTACACCSNYYRAVNGGVTVDQDHATSRHRFTHVPPSTPPGFWDLGFTPTE